MHKTTLASIAIGIGLVGCGTDSISDLDVAVVSSVVVSPQDPTLSSLGQTVQLTATARDVEGKVVSNKTFTWTSHHQNVAIVNESGLVTAEGNGTAEITATADSIFGSATITVAQVVTNVRVLAGIQELSALGETTQFNAVALDAGSNTVTGRAFEWSSSDTIVATVDAAGVVTAAANGTTRIEATTDGVVGVDTVMVDQLVATVSIAPDTAKLFPGDTVRLVATPRDANGYFVADAALDWKSHDTAVSVVDSSGLVTGVGRKLGPAQITATSEGQTGSAATIAVVTFASASAGGPHTCGITTDGATYCWGVNGAGQLGNGTWSPLPTTTPYAVSGGLTFSKVTAGRKVNDGVHAQSCGLSTNGAAYCWGLNDVGQLGSVTTQMCGGSPCSSTPVAVTGGVEFADLSTSSDHVCGVTSAGEAYCWGNNSHGQLGDGTASDNQEPVAVVGGMTFSSPNAGFRASCALTVGGTAYCWGNNSFGQLGDGTTTDRPTPGEVSGGLTLASLSTGSGGHSCGVTTSNEAYCWGANSLGELGVTTAEICSDGYVNVLCSTRPVAISGGLMIVSVTAGVGHSCGITNTGAAYCWGNNSAGELGDGSNVNREAPAAVVGGHTFASISAGLNHTCGITTGGIAYCWGSNSYGQLGTGWTTGSSIPVRVLGQP